jgi:hypothetical protein
VLVHHRNVARSASVFPNWSRTARRPAAKRPS